MRIAATTYDVTKKIENLNQFQEELSRIVTSYLDQGVELLLLPEYFLLKILEVSEVTSLASENEKLKVLHNYVYQQLIPSLQKDFCFYKNTERCLVLGSCFYLENEVISNRCSVLMKEKVLSYDKRSLTPSEKHLRAGKEKLVFDFKGVTCAVLICFDVEIPDFGIELREAGVELILIPSVTETEQGVARVQRCASARSVELCCYTVVSHLIGKCSYQMINIQRGCANYYVPPQSLTFAHRQINKELVLEHDDFFIKDFDFEAIRKQRQIYTETNPFHFKK